MPIPKSKRQRQESRVVMSEKKPDVREFESPPRSGLALSRRLTDKTHEPDKIPILTKGVPVFSRMKKGKHPSIWARTPAPRQINYKVPMDSMRLPPFEPEPPQCCEACFDN